jgi:Holliday junction resolvasome RuvABC endonuclease subunit
MIRRKKKSNTYLLYQKLDEIHKDIKEVREQDIPNLKVEIAVVKEKASTSAKVISACGAVTAVFASIAVAWIS